jgi:hypothetical protein
MPNKTNVSGDYEVIEILSHQGSQMTVVIRKVSNSRERTAFTAPDKRYSQTFKARVDLSNAQRGQVTFIREDG